MCLARAGRAVPEGPRCGGTAKRGPSREGNSERHHEHFLPQKNAIFLPCQGALAPGSGPVTMPIVREEVLMGWRRVEGASPSPTTEGATTGSPASLTGPTSSWEGGRGGQACSQAYPKVL